MIGDINGNLTIRFSSLKSHLTKLTANLWWYCHLCREYHAREGRKWRLGRGASQPGRAVSAEQTNPPLTGEEQKPGGGPAGGSQLSTVLSEDLWGAETVSLQGKLPSCSFALCVTFIKLPYFVFLIGSLSCWRGCTIWALTDHQGSRKTLCLWCWHSRESIYKKKLCFKFLFVDLHEVQRYKGIPFTFSVCLFCPICWAW